MAAPAASGRVYIQGLAALNAQLKGLADEFGPKAAASPVRAALRKGAQVMQRSAQSKVRVKTGTLKENIIVTSRGRPADGFIDMKVTIRAKAKRYADNSRSRRMGRVGTEYQNEGPLFYARFLEFGTSHQQRSPFLVPAFEENKETVGLLIRDELAKAIDKTLAKYKGVTG